MMRYIRLADRVFGRPLLITPEKAEIILGVLWSRFSQGESWDIEATELAPTPALNGFAGRRSDNGPYRITKEGIAIVPVLGTLVNRGAYVGASSGLTSYEGLTEQLTKADKDSEVRGILLDIDSPGGEAGGCFDLATLIQDIRKRKPVVAMVNDMACSAAYAIAASAKQIFISQTGLVGSIGVIMVHFDRSGALDQAGIKPTIISAGARKADGNPFGPLSKDVRERLQAEAETMRDMFVKVVVSGRPGLKAATVKDTEAGVYMGQSALDLGLADGISTFDSVLKVMSSQLGRLVPTSPGYTPDPTKEKKAMTDQAGASTPDTATLTANARAEGVKEGAAAERARVSGIMSLPEAEGRADLAQELVNEGVSVETAKKLLAKAPKADVKADAATMYAAIVAAGGKPGVPASDAGQKASVEARADANIKRQRERFAKR